MKCNEWKSAFFILGNFFFFAKNDELIMIKVKILSFLCLCGSLLRCSKSFTKMSIRTLQSKPDQSFGYTRIYTPVERLKVIFNPLLQNNEMGNDHAYDLFLYSNLTIFCQFFIDPNK